MAIKMPHTVKPTGAEKKADAFISGAGKAAPADDAATGKTIINLRVDSPLLARVDAAAKRRGISRTAWLCLAMTKALGEEGDAL
jgi:predicted DNA binding CopG/RHH family protein